MQPATSALLEFFQTIFPDELYSFGAAEMRVPAEAPAVAEATPAVPAPAAAAPPVVERISSPPTASAPPLHHHSTTPHHPTPPSVPASLPPSFIPGTTHQQSRGDGSGAVVVQRLPSAEFAKLNQNEFWVNFLNYLGLDWPTVWFVNVLSTEPLPLPELLASAPGARRLLLFGSGLETPVPLEAPAYERFPLPGGGPELLRAHAVADLTAERKRLLLTALQPWRPAQ